ncbi:MAG: YqgE/AlgH family protein [Bacteroidetes bacterium]|nr:YqgE/AlgH family protein [Bacteroidota bacterium]MBS1539563.1 YqgE/AlgH family protein [Bacteroidota bacterium]
MNFFDYTNNVKPQAGRLLISEPYLADPNFDRTIVLLCEHNHEGTIGFVLNRPSESTVSDLVSDLSGIQNIACIGGPVQQDTLHFLHRHPHIAGAVEVAGGIFWGGDLDEVIDSLQAGKIDFSDIKFFLGYSGWSFGQLEEEIKANSWIVSNHVSEELVFDTEFSLMWRTTLKEMGGRYSMYSNYPVDPTLN